MGSAMGRVRLYELLSRTGNRLHILYYSTSRSSSSTNPSKQMTGAGCEISSPYIDEPSILTKNFHIRCPHQYCATVTSKTTCMEVYCRLKVLKLVVSVHIHVSTQNKPVSLQCHWQVLKNVSFALNECMASLLFTSWKCFKQRRSIQKNNMNTENTYVLAYLVPSFLTFETHLPASPTSKQVYYHWQQI